MRHHRRGARNLVRVKLWQGSHKLCVMRSDALNTGSLSVLLHMAKSQPRAYREMLEQVMQEHFSSEHGLVEDLSAARRKRAKAGKRAYDAGVKAGHGSGQAGSPERSSVSPLRSPVRDGRGRGGERKSKDDEEIAEVHRALKHHAVAPADHHAVSHDDTQRHGVHVSRMNSEHKNVSAVPQALGAQGYSSNDDMSLDIDNVNSAFFDHVDGNSVGGWVGAREEQSRKKAPLRQILPAYLRAVPGGGSGAPRGGKGAQSRLAKNAAHGSFARATANEYGGHDAGNRARMKQGRTGVRNQSKVPRSRSHLGVEEDVIARTWAAPDFDDGSNDELYEAAKAEAWGEVGARRSQQCAIQRPRSVDDDSGLHMEPLLLDAMMVNPSGTYSAVQRMQLTACRSCAISFTQHS